MLRELLTSDRDAAAELVNAMLAEAQALPQLVRHDRVRLAPARGPADAPLATRITVETAMAMVDVIRADEMSRLGRLRRRRLRGPGARPVPQPVAALLQHRLRQPQLGGGVPRPSRRPGLAQPQALAR